MWPLYRFSFLSFCLILVFTAQGYAQFVLSGKVINETTGDVLPGATVEIHELNRSTTTNQDGQYRFENLRNTRYHIHITHVGFGATTISVKVDQDRRFFDFKIKPTAIELQEVLVESNHFKTGSKEQTLAMEILDADYLRRKGKNSLANALEDLPGINAVNTGVGIAKPVIRGMSHNRIIVNNQGIKQEGQQWGSDHGLEIDPFDPGRIEIIKGPSSLGYGSDGLGGVINIFSPPLPADSTFSGSFQTVYKSNNHLFGASGMAQASLNNKVFRARISGQDFGDYRVPANEFTYNSYRLPIYDNRLKNTAGKERNASLMMGVKKNWGYSTVTVSNFHQKAALFVGAVGIPRAYQLTPDNNNRNIDQPYQQTNHFKVVSNTSLLLGVNWVEIDLGYQLNARQEHSDPHAHGKNQLPEGTLAHALNLSTFSGNIRYFQRKENSTRIWGLQSEAQKNSRSGFEYLLPNYRRFSQGIYWLEEISWQDKYTLSGGIRGDYNFVDIAKTTELLYDTDQASPRDYVRNEALDRHNTNLSGSIGFSYYPNATLNAKLNLGSSFRVPAPNELAVNGIHHGTFRHELGNPTLKSERGYQLDANLSIQKKHLSLVASAFGSYYQNYIYLSPTAQFSSSLDPVAFPEGGQVYQFAQNNAVYGGGELAVDFHPIQPLHIKSTFECVYNLNLDSGLPLPFTPPPALFSEINYQFGFEHSVFSNLQLGINLKNVAAQHRTDRNERPTEGYYLLGAAASTSFQIGRFTADLSLTAQNTTNQFYINHLSRYKLLNLPEQGRNFSINLLIPFATL